MLTRFNLNKKKCCKQNHSSQNCLCRTIFGCQREQKNDGATTESNNNSTINEACVGLQKNFTHSESETMAQ